MSPVQSFLSAVQEAFDPESNEWEDLTSAVSQVGAVHVAPTVPDIRAVQANLAGIFDYGQCWAFWEHAVPEAQWGPAMAAVAHAMTHYFLRLGRCIADDSPVLFTAARLRLHGNMTPLEERSVFTAFLQHLTRILPAPEAASHLDEQVRFFLKRTFLKAFTPDQDAQSDAQAVRDALQKRDRTDLDHWQGGIDETDADIDGQH